VVAAAPSPHSGGVEHAAPVPAIARIGGVAVIGEAADAASANGGAASPDAQPSAHHNTRRNLIAPWIVRGAADG
jgi:hypothetical protein